MTYYLFRAYLEGIKVHSFQNSDNFILVSAMKTYGALRYRLGITVALQSQLP